VSSSSGAERAVVSETEARPLPLFDSSLRRARPVEELLRLLGSSDLVRELVLRNLRVMYKRSTLGVLWSLLHPLLLMAVLTFVFSSLFVHATPHFALHAFAGLVFWSFFAQATVWAMGDFVHGGAILRRVRVPASAFPVSSVLTCAVNFLLTLPVILAIAAFEGHSIGPALACLPLAFICVVAFAIGVALLLAAAAAYFADVIEMYRAGILAWMYLTPVFYPLEAIPETVRAWLWWNPVVPLLELFRRPIVHGDWPGGELAASAVAIALASLAAGWIGFADRSDDIVYRV
jgi:ABC-type polysaccharide/polyol phosphate export permease